MMLDKLTNPLELCELKFAGAKNGSRIFEGYASVFDGVDTYGDTILKGAFKKTLETRSRPVKMFFGHSPGRPLGKWLDVREDDKGLLARGELTPGNTDVDNVYASMKHGAIDGLSIGFRIPKKGATEKEDGGREIKQIDLIEISVVTMPADGDAMISTVKSIQEEIATINTIRDAELFLRDAGNFPRSMAKALISQLSTVYLREAEAEAEQKEAMREAKEWLFKITNR